jgi:hypothetical protein
MMKYRNIFDHLGNPHAKRTDWDGVFIVLGVIAIGLIVWELL